MRTSIVDAILRRVDARQSTGQEEREREERRRHVAQLVGEIAEPRDGERHGRKPRDRQFG